MEEKKPKCKSGIYGKAEACFGGKIFVDVVRFNCKDGIERHGITLAEFYNGCNVGETPEDKRLHDPQIFLVFDNIKSVEIVESALATVRENIKRNAERAENSQKLSPEMAALLSQKVEELDLSVRTLSCLRAAELETVRDICRCQKTDLLKFRNFGKKSLTELDDFLTKHGLEWGMEI